VVGQSIAYFSILSGTDEGLSLGVKTYADFEVIEILDDKDPYPTRGSIGHFRMILFSI